MPEYEFICRDCGRTFVAAMTVREHDTRLAPCPKCGKTRAVKKQLSGVSVVTSRKSA